MSNPSDIPENPLAIVNTNWGINNIVDLNDRELCGRIVNTLSTCSELLKSHCGPLSGFAALADNDSVGEVQNPSIFTRDGIRIMTNVDFLSPLERYFKKLLTYIGMRVDAKAKDGTTTSMLWSCELLKRIMELKLQDDASPQRSLTIHAINHICDKIFDDIFKTLNTHFVFNVDQLLEILGLEKNQETILAGKIAFIQALSSSGGNLELATAMRDIFTRSPRQVWEYITYSFAGRETDKQFYIREDEYDYRIACVPMLDNQLDSAMHTEHMRENVPCLVLINGAVAGSIEFLALQTFLSKYPKNVGLSIIAPYVDGAYINAINDMNSNRELNNKISVWQFSAQEALNGKAFNWKLQILTAIAGIKPFDPIVDTEIKSSHLFYPAKIYYHNKYLEFYGLVQDLDATTCLHPYVLHPETATPYYTDTLNYAIRLLKEAKESHSDDTHLVSLYTQVVNELMSLRRPSLQIGGTTHDQAANREVVQDVLGAIMSSLSHGFTISGVLSLYGVIELVCRQYRAELDKNPDSAELKMADYILTAMVDSIHVVVNTVYVDDSINKFTTSVLDNPIAEGQLVFDYINTLNGNVAKLQDYLSVVPSVGIQPNKTDSAVVDNYPVMQPIKIPQEMITRVHELVIKFLFTNKIVVAGGVLVDKEKTNGSN